MWRLVPTRRYSCHTAGGGLIKLDLASGNVIWDEPSDNEAWMLQVSPDSDML